MKKIDLIKFFFTGGCIGVTLIKISDIVINLLEGNVNPNLASEVAKILFSFMLGSIFYILAIVSLDKIKYKDLSSKQKQTIFKEQIVIVSTVIILFFIIFLIYMIRSYSFGMILCLSFITAFTVWDYGCLIAYLNLKKNMAMINTKRQN